MLENRSPRKLFWTLIAIGALLGASLDQLILVLAGKLDRSDASIFIWGLFTMLLLPRGWQMVASLPWGTINDPARYEYRNPLGPSKTVVGGGRNDSTSISSPSPAAGDDPKP
jgi:hypothetical protein